MITKQVAVLPDDARFDPIAWATGAEGFDQGVTFDQLRAMDTLLTGQDGSFGGRTMVAWRRSYMEGFLRAMYVKTARVEAERFEAWTGGVRRR